MGSTSLLTTTEIARLLRVHPKHVYRLLRQGLPAERLGGQWRFVEGDVRAWMQARAEGPALAPPRAETGSPATPALLVANGDVAIERVLATLNEPGGAPIGLVHGDSGTGLARLRQGEVTMSGIHGQSPLERGFVRIDVAEREVGLVARGRTVPPFAALPGLVLASRPPTAPMRRYLEAALEAGGARSRQVLRKAKVFRSHGDVVFSVLRGETDVGVTTRAWAERGGLAFHPLATEIYGVLVRLESMASPPVARLFEALQSSATRRLLRGLRGYDVAPLGRVHLGSA